MKTRVVFPSIWDNDKFSALSKNARYAVNFLINNDKLALSRYSQISDKYATYCTGLSLKEWDDVKDELQKSKLFFFYQGWVYHNHDFAYIDYSGRDRVVQGKEKELKNIPSDVVEHFNGLLTGKEEVANPSPATHKPINHKLIKEIEGIREKGKTLQDFIDHFNSRFKKNYTTTSEREKWFRERIKATADDKTRKFTFEQLIQAVDNTYQLPEYHGQNKDKWVVTPDYYLRNDRNLDTALNKQPLPGVALKPITKKERDVLALARDKQAQINYFKENGYDTSSL